MRAESTIREATQCCKKFCLADLCVCGFFFSNIDADISQRRLRNAYAPNGIWKRVLDLGRNYGPGQLAAGPSIAEQDSSLRAMVEHICRFSSVTAREAGIGPTPCFMGIEQRISFCIDNNSAEAEQKSPCSSRCPRKKTRRRLSHQAVTNRKLETRTPKDSFHGSKYETDQLLSPWTLIKC